MILKKTLVLMLVMFGINTAQAQDYFPAIVQPKLKDYRSKLDTVYVGVGLAGELMHFNAEWVSDYGIAYAKVGSFFSGDQELGGFVGFRVPYHFTGTDANGYYVGVNAGTIDNMVIDGKYKQRLGIGVDLSYVMLDKERISTATVGASLGQEMPRADGTKVEVQPQILLAYSLSFNAF